MTGKVWRSGEFSARQSVEVGGIQCQAKCGGRGNSVPGKVWRSGEFSDRQSVEVGGIQ